MSPGAVTRLVADAGLRGRGGGGLPDRPTSGAPARAADAGVALRRRQRLRGRPGRAGRPDAHGADPHAVLEGVALAAYAVGAATGIHRRHARLRPRPPRRLRAAIARRGGAGYLGSDALGTGFELHVEVRELSRRLRRRRGDVAAAGASRTSAPSPTSGRRTRPSKGLWGRADRRQQRRDAGRRALDRGQRRRAPSPTSATPTRRARRSSR